ncbi:MULTISPECIES: SPOR domain-containing protein [Flavobacteriaceae]|uniref:SPOR domain-containing protein n=1 Tax=Flavobacteriaceae TaxID=49546 RepID=UPI0014914ADE|nr:MULTISPECIES: SPOR domain-containing protein [Allomuricauda]MDC6367253.1 SPOR domain-containing protein [Muricauda sp. AC10]
MKTPIYILLLTGFTLGLSAQEGTVSIEQDARIDELIQLYTEVNSKAKFYQIQVGFGTYQKAQNLKSKVDVDFPNWYSKIEFESPTYRVRLGKFKTKLEAERKFLEVRKKYPDAMLLKPESDAR